METTIGAYDADTRQVPVTFVDAGVTHERGVNACLDDKDAYDAEATADRVAAVALGVAYKIANGIITNPPPAAEADTAPSAEPETAAPAA